MNTLASSLPPLPPTAPQLPTAPRLPAPSPAKTHLQEADLDVGHEVGVLAPQVRTHIVTQRARKLHTWRGYTAAGV